jgi:MFS transporter, FSR family, fosmidomycin resistance protein
MTPPATAIDEDRSAFALAAAYGAVHLLVDLATVTAAYRAARAVGPGFLGPFEIVLGYDLVAFGLQLPLGIAADWLNAARRALVGGLALTLCGLFLIPVSAVATMAVVGLGNALFHLGAGAAVLTAAKGRAGPAGVFVAPGAIGLGLGIWFGRSGVAAAWPISGLVAIGLVATVFLRGPRPKDAPIAFFQKPARQIERVKWSAVLALLLLSVAIRSFVGFAGTFRCDKTSMLIIAGVPLAGFAGKLVGGIVSDRAGWIDTSVGALLVSAPLIAYGGGSAYAVVAGLLIFQMTMPVTLTAVYLLMPDKPATAFGWPCLALIAGAMPTFYPWGKALYGSHAFAALIVVSALVLCFGLKMLGVHQTPTAIRKGAG